MKCNLIECKRLARRAASMKLHELEHLLTKCNRCFYSLDPASRHSEKNRTYKTRNEVGAAYALAYFKQNVH